jgi:hypothetical protein
MIPSDFQALSTVQSNVQPGPVTLTAAATLAPTTFLTIVTGTTALATITPPVNGTHMLAFAPSATNWAGTVTTGNILVATTPAQNKVQLLVYNPLTAKYYPV